MNDLPSLQEWEEAGFSVPDDLCSKLPPYPYIMPFAWENGKPCSYHVKLSADAPLLICMAYTEQGALDKAKEIMANL